MTRSPVQRASLLRAAHQAGYTIVEVMMALAVLAIGASGVSAMQRATLVANGNARNIATGNAIAEAWVERLRADAAQWNDTTDLADTRWLKLPQGIWQAPSSAVAAAPFGSGWASVTGEDIYNNGGPAAFCTHLRLNQLYPNLMRAEIRVFWLRNNAAMPDCSEANPDAILASPDRYAMVYVTSGVFANTAP